MAAHTRSSLELAKWDPLGTVECFVMAVFGQRNTGKSCLVRDIIYRLHVKGYPRIVVFSGTEEANAGYRHIVPAKYVHSGMNVDDFRILYETQKRIVSTWREAMERCPEQVKDVDPRLVIILDDLMFRKNLTRSELFGELACNGRHWKIVMIVTCQYIMQLDPVLRQNLDYVLVLRESIPRSMQKLYQEFFGIFRKRDDFYKVLSACTENYECLVLDKTKPTNEIQSVVHWYRADVNLPPFVFGSSESRAWANSG